MARALTRPRRWCWVLALACATAALAQELPPPDPASSFEREDPLAESEEPRGAYGDRGFTLGLATMPLEAYAQFRLFDLEAPRVASNLGQPGADGWGNGSSPLPGIGSQTPIALTPVLSFDLAGSGRTELRLFRLDRKTWDELDTWEKIGLVTSYASAVAGVVGMALELAD